MERILQSLFQTRQGSVNEDPQQYAALPNHAQPAGSGKTTKMGTPVILITGALTGIGRATALVFAREGATVVAAGRREAEGNALEAELRALGAQAAFIKADVRHEEDVRR